jgi:glucan biosynthesis protein C
MALALGVVTYLWRMVVPIGFWIPVVDLPTGAYLPQYIGFFGLGIVAFRRRWFHTITIRMGAFGLGLAVCATLVFFHSALPAGTRRHSAGERWARCVTPCGIPVLRSGCL